MDKAFLPGLPVGLIRSAFENAGGHENARLDHPKSSAALVANTFGLFLGEAADRCPPLPRTRDFGWPAISVCLEKNIHFPWAGGRHPWLDVLIETDTHSHWYRSQALCNRFVARPKDQPSDAYSRPVWGDRMQGYERVRDQLKDGDGEWLSLYAGQLFKHAFALRTAVHKNGSQQHNKTPVLYYLYAEPSLATKRFQANRRNQN